MHSKTLRACAGHTCGCLSYANSKLLRTFSPRALFSSMLPSVCFASTCTFAATRFIRLRGCLFNLLPKSFVPIQPRAVCTWVTCGFICPGFRAYPGVVEHAPQVEENMLNNSESFVCFLRGAFSESNTQATSGANANRCACVRCRCCLFHVNTTRLV